MILVIHTTGFFCTCVALLILCLTISIHHLWQLRLPVAAFPARGCYAGAFFAAAQARHLIYPVLPRPSPIGCVQNPRKRSPGFARTALGPKTRQSLWGGDSQSQPPPLGKTTLEQLYAWVTSASTNAKTGNKTFNNWAGNFTNKRWAGGTFCRGASATSFTD